MNNLGFFIERGVKMAKRLKRISLEELVKLTEQEAQQYISQLERKYERQRRAVMKVVGTSKLQIEEMHTLTMRDVRSYFKTLYQRSKRNMQYGVSDYQFEKIQDVAFQPLNYLTSFITSSRTGQWINSVLSTGFKADREVVMRAIKRLDDSEWNEFFTDDHYFQQINIKYRWDKGGDLALYHNRDPYGTGYSPWVQRLVDFFRMEKGIDLTVDE